MEIVIEIIGELFFGVLLEIIVPKKEKALEIYNKIKSKIYICLSIITLLFLTYLILSTPTNKIWIIIFLGLILGSLAVFIIGTTIAAILARILASKKV